MREAAVRDGQRSIERHGETSTSRSATGSHHPAASSPSRAFPSARNPHDARGRDTRSGLEFSVLSRRHEPLWNRGFVPYIMGREKISDRVGRAA